MPNNTRKYAATKTQNRKSGSALKSGVTSIQSAKPNTKLPSEMNINSQYGRLKFISVRSGLTKKAEPPPARDVNRDSGTDSANGGWLRRLVRRRHGVTLAFRFKIITGNQSKKPVTKVQMMEMLQAPAVFGIPLCAIHVRTCSSCCAQ